MKKSFELSRRVTLVIFMKKKQNWLSYEDGLSRRADFIGRTYLLNHIDFRAGDTVIDCGANVGDLKLYFDDLSIAVDYHAFEPSKREFFCLSKNVGHQNAQNFGLWKNDGELEFFVSSSTADSSLIRPEGFDDIQKISVRKLDSLFTKKIKLLKLEAEGAEPEVLEGAINLIRNIHYISADLGFERGVRQESTLVPVTNFLTNHGFELVDFAVPRVVVLFRNKFWTES